MPVYNLQPHNNGGVERKQDSEVLPATPERLQLAPALTDKDSNVEHVVMVQTLEAEDKPQEELQ